MNRISTRLDAVRVMTVLAMASLVIAVSAPAAENFSFKRIATYPVFLNTCAGEPAECVDEETVAEIAAVSSDGRTVAYTDGATEKIGFVDITVPDVPVGMGVIAVGGEPTAVAITGPYALAGVNTSEDFVNTSGHLSVIHIPTMTVVRTIDLGGQPDSVAVSKSGRFAAVAIENERNEDLCVGGMSDGQEVDEDVCEADGGKLGWLPQMPAGFVVIVDLLGDPRSWSTRDVELTGVADLFPTDPEPEFVSISDSNIAAVTLQENNHVVLIDLPSGTVVGDFSAGTTDLTEIDTSENDLIEPNSGLTELAREPDAVTWIGTRLLATADEGDLLGGSRGFTIFDTRGAVVYSAGNEVEHVVTRVGHYPEDRSENKGSEPEGVAFGTYGTQNLLFVGSERSSVVLVYEIEGDGSATYRQVLPGGVGPEGLLPIPERSLFVTASEEDDRGGKFRAGLTIYEWSPGAPAYPTILSGDRTDGTPIPWAALSALAGDPDNPCQAFTVYDSFYRESRIFEIDACSEPAMITREIVLRTADGGTLDLDPEGLNVRALGTGFWVASEGNATCTEVGVCEGRLNLLVKTDRRGNVVEQIELPDAVNDRQIRFGFEGVTSTGVGDSELVYVAFQREWLEDPARHVRIGRYEVKTGEWTFFYYPLDPRESPFGGWVGLSEITAIDDTTFLVLERDNQAGTDARIKRIYKVSIDGVEPQSQGGEFPVLTKTLVRDILPDLASANGSVIEKVEGHAVLANGDSIIVTDNDGVDDSSGETQYQNLGVIH